MGDFFLQYFLHSASLGGGGGAAGSAHLSLFPLHLPFSVDLSSIFFSAVFGLADLEDLLAMKLRKKFRPELFNSGNGKSDSAQEHLQSAVKGLSHNRCAVCGTTENLSVAHIMKKIADCETLGCSFGASNFIVLCGSLGEAGTCHHYFDNFQMSFGHVSGKWNVVGGKHHGREVVLPTNPPKRFLHSHFARCVLNKSLIGVDGDFAADLEFSDESEELF